MHFGVFISQYFKNPKTVGSVSPSSEKLAKGMLEGIDFLSAKCIVEYGPGTGVFTERILNQKNDSTVLMTIECNKTFFDMLNEKYADEKNFIIINGSAENITEYLEKHHIDKVDYVVSSLPFSSLPSDISRKVLVNTRKILGDKGRFITFQYTLLKYKLFRSYFSDIKIKSVFFNLPPAYVLKCNNFPEK